MVRGADALAQELAEVGGLRVGFVGLGRLLARRLAHPRERGVEAAVGVAGDERGALEGELVVGGVDRLGGIGRIERGIADVADIERRTRVPEKILMK